MNFLGDPCLPYTGWLIKAFDRFNQPTTYPFFLPPPRSFVFSFSHPMTSSLFLVSLVLTATPYLARAQTTTTATSSAFTPLASKSFSWNNLVGFFLTPSVCTQGSNLCQQPYQADPDNGVRGTQRGYNRCNSTTENQKSLCQTAVFNSIDGE